MRAPDLKSSTIEERRQYIKNTFKCIADCDFMAVLQDYK